MFDARLLALTPSSVAYSCLHYGNKKLVHAVSNAGLTRHTTNAATTFKATDFYRFFIGERVAELTSTRKGRTGDLSVAGYSAIQALSSKNHKSINTAICKSLSEYVHDIGFSDIQFEVDAGEQNLITDAILPSQGQQFHLEFHHLSVANCKAAKMSAYIMKKLRNYAIHYNLIPR